MVTMLKMPRRWEDGSYNFGFGGKSTDVKPVKTWDEYEIANGSSFFEIDTLNMYFYDKDSESWIKAKIEAGGHAITADNITAAASVDNQSGTPTVTVDKTTDGRDVKFTFNFRGLKGEQGDKGDKGATGSGGGTDLSDIDVFASVDDTVGTPSVKVTKATNVNTGNDELIFAFTGLKGEKGDAGSDSGGAKSFDIVATVDDTSGTPSVEVVKSEDVVTHGFTYYLNFKGLKGESGSSSGVSDSISAGTQNTVKSSGGAIGAGNDVNYASLAVGHNNVTKGVDSAAVGNRVVATSNQLVVGDNFNGISQWQDQFMFNNGRAFPFVVASNSSESDDFVFAVPTTYNDDGGIIIQGKNGASKAYYLLKIIGGNLSITDITSKIKFGAGS